MKIPARRAEAFARRPDPTARAVLVYGPDRGLVRERADILARTVVADLADPFRVTELASADLDKDPARLFDEAAALALTGGRRVVRVHQAGDGQAEAFQRLLEEPPGEALIVVEAGDLSPRSSLRRFFEAAHNAAALPCYRDEGAALERVIGETLEAYGLTPEPAALSYLADRLGGDRLVTRSELDKLAVYMGREKNVRLADVEACVGDSSALTLESVALAAASGDLARLERGLARAFGEGIDPVAVLRAVARHLRRVHLLAGLMERGASVDDGLATFRPSLHFRLADALRGQAKRWTREAVAQALEAVTAAEIECKTTGRPARTICRRTLARVSTAAGA
ncbi:MAG: DNA polymerase III subunit delta [Alphaproteobacteria bacterium]